MNKAVFVFYGNSCFGGNDSYGSFCTGIKYKYGQSK